MPPAPLPQRLRSLLFADGGLPLVWLALTICALYPIWHQRMLPMLDSANHLALSRGWHDYYDPTSRVAEFYTLRVRVVPYFLFYGSIHLLLYVFPVEIANKIFISAYVILFPLAVLAVARSLGRSGWLALFGFPLLFNQNWIYGFSSYLMSVALSLFAFASLVSYLETRKLRYALALGVTTLLCYLGHIMPWFLFGLCAIGVVLLYWRNWQAGLIAAVVMLPSVVLAVSAVIDEQGDRTYIKDAPFAGTFKDFPTSVQEFPRRVMELFPGDFDAYVLMVLAATLAALFIWRGADDRIAKPVSPTSSRVLKLALWVLGLAYVSLPYSITKPMSWWYVAPRIPSLFMAFLVLAPAIELRGLRRLAFLPVVLCAIALPIKLGALYRNFSSRNMPVMRLIEETPRGALTLVVVRGMMRGAGSEERSGDPVTSGPVYWHFSSWPMALKGGYSPYLFDQGIPLRPKNPLPAPPWGSTDAFTFRQAPKFEYYIVRDAPAEFDREPSVKLQRRIGEWTLYKRIHEITEEP